MQAQSIASDRVPEGLTCVCTYTQKERATLDTNPSHTIRTLVPQGPVQSTSEDVRQSQSDRATHWTFVDVSTRELFAGTCRHPQWGLRLSVATVPLMTGAVIYATLLANGMVYHVAMTVHPVESNQPSVICDSH
jgi:hypothetical protein